MQVDEIPQWMEQFIPEITDGAFSTKAELLVQIGEEKDGMAGVVRSGHISFINNRIHFLKNLKKANKI